MGSNDFITLFFLVAAVLIFLQLRSVLGRRTGNEKPPIDSYSPRDAAKTPAPGADDGKVVTLPRRDADQSFNPKEFLNGAKMAYEMIVMAFADGDRKTLKGLLSKEVFDGFEAAIRDRESRGEVIKSTFVGIDKSAITQVVLKQSEAQVTIRIVSQLISATFDKDGKLIDGDQETVAEVTDIWTFARDVRSKDPNWKLIATESEQ